MKSMVMLTKEHHYLLQTENREFIHTRLGTDHWITIYRSFMEELDNGAYFCALIPNSRVAATLARASWDLSIGTGLPGCEYYYDGEDKIIEYHSLGDKDKIIPLVIKRDFFGIKPHYIEVLEEFRLFHNLYHDQRNNIYFKIHDNGLEEEIVRVENKRVEIKQKAIRQFLAIKDMHLAIYFDIHRYSSLSIEDVDPSLRLIEVRENNLTYNFHAVAWEFPDDERQTFSRLLGKKLIAGVSKEKSGIWPYNEKSAQEKNYVEFIIGYDDEGEEVYHSCDPDLLANYFGANPGSPHYLTPVYFRREVMTKYFNNPDKFSITDGYLHCGNLWGLRLDNNHANYIIVFLGDLGGLYYEEQMYWRSFNLLPGTSISDVNFKRSFLGEFADPERSDLLFKFRFEQFQEKWESHFGWPLFKPLNENDQYLYSALHVPLTNDQVEFDGQVLALTKIVIDSLNEKQIARFLQDLDPNSRGITKLEKFLELHKVSNSEQIIDFLKNLYTLRSTGIGHRKSKSYKKIAQVFKIGERDLILIFEEILNQLIALLNVLESEFLSG